MISVAGISENLRELPRISNMFQFCSESLDLLTFSIQMVVTVVEMVEMKVEMEER